MAKKNGVIDLTAMILLVVGGINWGLVGLMDLNLVTTVFGGVNVLTRVVYGAVGISALWVGGLSLMKMLK